MGGGVGGSLNEGRMGEKRGSGLISLSGVDARLMLGGDDDDARDAGGGGAGSIGREVNG